MAEVRFPSLMRGPGGMPETELAHRAFLLWAMQDQRDAGPGTLRSVARAVDRNPGTIASWRKKKDWEDRVGTHTPDVQRGAAELYAELYHTKHGGREVALVQEGMVVPYTPPPEDAKTLTARAVDVHTELQREERRKKDMKRIRGLEAMADGLSVQLLRHIKAGDCSACGRGAMEVKPSDATHIIRLLAFVEQHRPAAHSGGGDQPEADGAGDAMVGSQRLAEAERTGRDPLDALEEDAEELLLIVRTMRADRAVRLEGSSAAEA